MTRTSYITQVVSLVVLFAIVADANVNFICQYMNCPRFLTRAQNPGYEERVYASENWVSTDGDVANIDQSRLEMFQRLLAYFNGTNVEGKKMNMTFPFLTKVTRAAGSNTTTAVSMYMYIPHAKQTTPPTPTDPKVRLEKTPVQSVYIRSFGGWSSRELVQRMRSAISEAVGASKLSPDFYLATYSFPLQWRNRYNEIWLGK